MRRLIALVALCIAFGPAPAARAQVIEISDDGQVTTYDRPTAFVDGAARPLFAVADRTNGADWPTTKSATPPVSIGPTIANAARAEGLQPELLAAVAWQESRGRMTALSPKGAIGVMQLMPGTAREIGVNPHDPTENIMGGARYLRRQIDRFGTVPLALAAYNAGPAAVSRFGGIPPYRETRSYVSSILARLQAAGIADRRIATVAPSYFSQTLLIEVLPL